MNTISLVWEVIAAAGRASSTNLWPVAGRGWGASAPDLAILDVGLAYIISCQPVGVADAL